MESSDFNWNYIIPVLSIIIGWSLNQFSQFLLTRNSDKRKLKSLLFNLLEMYHLLLRTDVSSILNKVTEVAMNLVPEEARTAENRQELYTFYEGLMSQYITSDLEKDFNSLNKRYEDIINELAEIDPTTAYYLSGKAAFLEKFDIADSIKENLIELFPDDEKAINHHTKTLIGQMKGDLLAETIEDLESQLRHIAWKVGPIQWWRIKSTILSINKRVNEIADKKMEEMVEKIKINFYGGTKN